MYMNPGDYELSHGRGYRIHLFFEGGYIIYIPQMRRMYGLFAYMKGGKWPYKQWEMDVGKCSLYLTPKFNRSPPKSYRHPN